ncbi:MAG: GntR family transcriptional regulator, partial [Thiomonas sp.]
MTASRKKTSKAQQTPAGTIVSAVAAAESSLPDSTQIIVAAITAAIIEHRLAPGAKLTEQKIAAIYGVSRTIVRQALF